MNASQNFHRVKKIRVERYIESVGSITLEIVCGSIHDSEKGHESKMEITLFDLPMPQRLQLWNSFKDGKSHWICDDENEDQPSAVDIEDIIDKHAARSITSAA